MIMDLKTLADAIGLNKEAKDIINSSNISDIDFNSLIESFYKDSNVFFNKELSKENIQFNLVFISKLAVFLYPKFIDNGYTDKIYYDTFSDIRVWNENCVKETGICGLKETDWLSLHLKMQLFKIGRLQFQFNILDKDYKVEDKIYNKGTNVFSLHIQRGEPLTDISCIESIKEAKKYFGNEMICICSSCYYHLC